VGEHPELVVVDYDPSWPARFAGIATRLRERLGAAAERIDHIGSTSVPGLAAKDVIDIQITVTDLEVADGWPDALVDGIVRSQRRTAGDHEPPGSTSPDEWSKHYWSGSGAHVHVRELGRANQRYALLFRDYLRADDASAASYGALKRGLAAAAQGDWDHYYAVKDPACDLIMRAAEEWARRSAWTPGSPDA
jgi:GrpB-like predicted nucleotidyltransferase (UPF0157 family)